MEKQIPSLSQGRRDFLGTLAAGAASLGIASIITPINAIAGNVSDSHSLPGEDDPDAWFKKIKGKHRIAFDVTEPKSLFPFAWPRVFLLTNKATGSPFTDCGVVVILRHDAIPYAMSHDLWSKYNFTEMFHTNNHNFKGPEGKNPFWKPEKPFSVPGFGEIEIGIEQLQRDGVKFCVCDAAMTVYSAIAADKMSMDAKEVKKEWVAGLIPGVQPVPSGVWAVGRANENGFAYCSVS